MGLTSKSQNPNGSGRGLVSVAALVFTCLLPGIGHAEKPAVSAPALIFPLKGGADWSDTFGAPRSGHTHQGQDLMAPQMRPLVACFDGVVTLRRETKNGSAGNWIMLKASNGWQAWYMHLNNDTPGTDDGKAREEHIFAPGLKTGMKVKAGQLLGFNGDSGNAEDSGHHCHFELHSPTATINPASALRTAKMLGGAGGPVPVAPAPVNPTPIASRRAVAFLDSPTAPLSGIVRLKVGYDTNPATADTEYAIEIDDREVVSFPEAGVLVRFDTSLLSDGEHVLKLIRRNGQTGTRFVADTITVVVTNRGGAK